MELKYENDMYPSTYFSTFLQVRVDFAIFNRMLEMCDRGHLGVDPSDLDGCRVLLSAVANSLNVMIDRQDHFPLTKIPRRFLNLGVTRKKKPNRLTQDTVEAVLTRLSGVLHGKHAFTRSSLWAAFCTDASVLASLLQKKLTDMKSHVRKNQYHYQATPG